MQEIIIPCSPEQEQVIADHLLLNSQLGMLPDERAWILCYIKKLNLHGKIKSAELDLENAKWRVTLQT